MYLHARGHFASGRHTRASLCGELFLSFCERACSSELQILAKISCLFLKSHDQLAFGTPVFFFFGLSKVETYTTQKNLNFSATCLEFQGFAVETNI